MESSGSLYTRLPGFGSLDAVYQDGLAETFSTSDVDPYMGDRPDRVYLEHPVFHHYLKMHKVMLGVSGMRELVSIADQLSSEKFPRFIDAAASAYAEVGMLDTSLTAVERIKLINSAEREWQKAGMRWAYLDQNDSLRSLSDAAEPYRYATNLAFTPLMKSLVVGNVTESVMQNVLTDNIEIGRRASRALTDALEDHDIDAIGDFIGLLHETNALIAMLYLQDPRYIPMPSSARADTGYYHREQTHDISIINQHWGEIRKLIPVEVKSKASLRDRRRYNALIIRGKMHLTPNNIVDPRVTNDAYARVMEGSGSLEDHVVVEQLSTTVRELLRLYQKGIQPASIAIRSLTKFHDNKEVVRYFPELSKEPRKSQTNHRLSGSA